MSHDDPFGRATNVERYRSLHAAAHELIDRSVADFDVTRHDGVDLDGAPSPAFPGAPATRLEPAGGGAPVVLTFTPFPGVSVRFGHGGHDAFPSCGCDACDEDPDDEAERLTDLIADLAAGGFTEVRRCRLLRADLYESTFVRRDGDRWGRSGERIAPEVAASFPVGTVRWAPWSRRQPPG